MRWLPSLALLLSPIAAAQVGTPSCFGSSCPCGNDDLTAGCANHGDDGNHTTGASLTTSGTADVGLDDLTLTVAGIVPNQFGLIFLGELNTSVTTGDGIRCVGAGPNGLWRFPVQQADGSGSFQLTGVVAASQNFGATGWIDAGETWSFQGWFRDPNGPCGGGSNFTNAMTVTFEPPGSGGPIEAELGGRPLGAYPFFERTRSSFQGENLHACIDSTLYPHLVGVTGDLYVVEAKTATAWDADPSLVDARFTGSQPMTIVGGGVTANTVLIDAGTLNGTTGTQVGVGYDIVFDADQSGDLSNGDVIDGYGPEAGVYVCRDTEAAGPHAVTEQLYNGGTWRRQDIYYPTDIATMGQLPVLVVSHGNGHDYQWYDHIGFHMASYGWIVMSHRNNTGPGINSASLTTLDNTDHFLGNLDTIVGGVLDGHVDTGNIAWIGHSRGGEGVVRAYDRVFDNTYVPNNFTIDDIQLVSSIAPTVFLSKGDSHPHKVDYHLWIGAADSDVWGAPNQGSQLYSLLERSNGHKACITVQGAGHGVFHDGGGSWWANGPCQVSPARNHQIMRGYLLPMLHYFVFGDRASRDFLWREYEDFQPPGAPTNGDGCINVNLEYQTKGAARFIIDDFESESDTGTSSSGQAVTFDVTDLVEGRMQDANTSLDWNSNDPFNGMTRATFANEDPHCIVFEWDSPTFLEFAVDPAGVNFSDFEMVSFRACQGTRHPHTQSVLGPLTFQVSLRDGSGTTSTIDIGAYGGGIDDPYQRQNIGSSPGWANEFETIRVRIQDFLADGSGLNLNDITAVRFDFGAPTSAVGRLGFDDLELQPED